ncbi:hypothetical protein BH24DEI2_BH24DEI2_02900 [soil metagenome]
MPNPPESPWRAVFEQVRVLVGKRRDEQGVLGSINWLRAQMSARGANPNVVRNIIYRDKGKLADKRALFDILKTLWTLTSDVPLQAPELEALLDAEIGAEQDVQLLGREKRRVYSHFVSSVRAGQHPKLLVSGRPGSGKTLLLDYVQQALEPPPEGVPVVRLEFGADLAAGLTQLAVALELPRESIETKLVKAAAQSAYAVQADAQAVVARSLLDAVRACPEPPVLLLHLSQSLSEQRSLGVAPLRLHTPDVPRVSAAEWLWLSLLEPLSHLRVSLLVSAASLPLRAAATLGGFEDPVKLNPPTVTEARHFVRARLPQLDGAQQEGIVQRSGRSFEELRTLTLLTELREPLLERSNDPKHLDQLGDLLETAGDDRLRDFLSALAVVSLPDATFGAQALSAVRSDAWPQLNGLETAFLDPVPGREGVYRPFSRQFARTMHERFAERQGDNYRTGHRRAAAFYESEARSDPGGEAAARHLRHLTEARDWDALYGWLQVLSIPQTLLHRLWTTAESELLYGEAFEKLAVQVAVHYVRLGSYTHPDALRAFEVLDRSDREDMRLWTLLKRAEGAVLKGRIEVAATLLQGWTHTDSAELNVEHALLQASLARWRSDVRRAAGLVDKTARPLLSELPDDRSGRLVRAKVAVWAGLIAKDRGDLVGALHDFGAAASADDLVGARIAFQRGDVLLQLGRFDAALVALSDAVVRARRSEALVQEQSRYLARRGNLQRLRGQWAAAAADFEEALSGLESVGDPLERAFWRAKVEDEGALLALARGDFDAAILVLHRNREVFAEYAAGHGVDVTYRSLRNGLRSALAYGLRGLASPYRLPFGHRAERLENPDLRHARRLLGEVGTEVAARFADRAAYETLQRETLLVETLLAATPSEAIVRAERAAALARFDHQEATSQAFLAAAHLRTGNPEAATAATTAARRGHAALDRLGRHGSDESDGLGAGGGDLGLRAWLHSLELQALVARSEVTAALEHTLATLQKPHLHSYREPLLRALGESLEAALGDDARRHPAVMRVFGPALTDPAVRLADALVAGGEKLSALVVTAG